MGGRFVESVKNARWSMSLQEAGDGLESIIEFKAQIKGQTSKSIGTNVRKPPWGCSDWVE